MMGRLRSKTNRAGLTVNGVRLGEPVILQSDMQAPGPGDTISDAWFVWDDEAYPDGQVNADGTVTADQR
jgi:hypothetical protein